MEHIHRHAHVETRLIASLHYRIPIIIVPQQKLYFRNHRIPTIIAFSPSPYPQHSLCSHHQCAVMRNIVIFPKILKHRNYRIHTNFFVVVIYSIGFFGNKTMCIAFIGTVHIHRHAHVETRLIASLHYRIPIIIVPQQKLYSRNHRVPTIIGFSPSSYSRHSLYFHHRCAVMRNIVVSP